MSFHRAGTPRLSSTLSHRAAGEGLKATTDPIGASAAASRAASSARPMAICSAS